MGPGQVILIIFAVLILAWFLFGKPGFSLTVRFGGSENMIDEAQWLEIPRGFNEPNGGVSYKPLDALYQIEQTQHVDQVRLDPTVVI